MFTLKIQRLGNNVQLPSFAHHGDAGMDIFAAESVEIEPGGRKAVPTGFSTEFAAGYVALVWDRSSLAFRHGIKSMAGVIDSGYRGEWKIVLLNTTSEVFSIKAGDKIAQALFQPVVNPKIEVVQNLQDSQRGQGGFGSTGR